ncbi:MAG TPA: tRNA (adenosine(37)-N6)-threonylcarbamoyltransferase complex dimerization subunit type 1 TsaB [Longimicrobiales bacterium]|nr:tRNA (adenosine(37)-N6)-threonylcarbamoyltransferase complex dimerization subunit type 1 TsaB [Longimicrobiales bacterium]
MTTPGFRDDGFYLALDTSGPVGYVAVSRGAEVLARARMERQGKHAARIVPTIDAVLTEAGLEIGGLAGIVVGEGPGSFTGVRVAAATAKGLARALDVPLWALSSLAAAAVGDLGAGGPGVRYVLFDARADRVYGACYGVGSRGVETILPPYASDLRAILGSDVPLGALFAGDGAERHRSAIEGSGYGLLAPPVGDPTADGLLHLMALHPETLPTESLELWEPRYAKASNAEREWKV